MSPVATQLEECDLLTLIGNSKNWYILFWKYSDSHGIPDYDFRVTARESYLGYFAAKYANDKHYQSIVGTAFNTTSENGYISKIAVMLAMDIKWFVAKVPDVISQAAPCTESVTYEHS